jgi:putative sterol carrier protein
VRVDLSPLRTATPDEAARFFAEVDAEELVAAVAATPDDELTAIVDRDEIRPVAVEGILARLGEYAVPERLAAMAGTVRIDLERRGRVVERHGLTFSGGTIGVLTHVDADHPADVVLRSDALRFVRLVSGGCNAALEYLAGTLHITGSADLALALGGMFRVPGSDDAVVDPAALDPVDVATALTSASRKHLEGVMTSGFRPLVLGEIFRRLPDLVDPAAAGGTSLTVGFRLTGNPSGEVERYVVRLASGVATVEPGDSGGPRDATVTCQAHDFLRLATGHLNAVTGVLKGQLKVKGDRAKALKLTSVIDIPKPR